MLTLTLHKQKFKVLSHEADIHICASLYSFSNYLQEAARNHAEQLGLGIGLLKNKKQFWVLTRMIIKIDEFPLLGSEIEVLTWPKGADKLFALRDFEVYQNGKIIGKATSSWALLQLSNRRPIAVSNLGKIMFERQDVHAIDTPPKKLPTPKNVVELPNHAVRFSELDLNGHVNNTRYINWMMDTFQAVYHKTHMVTHVQMNFLAEVFPDQELKILREEIAPDNFLFEVQNDQEKPLFRGELQFKSLTSTP